MNFELDRVGVLKAFWPLELILTVFLTCRFSLRLKRRLTNLFPMRSGRVSSGTFETLFGLCDRQRLHAHS